MLDVYYITNEEGLPKEPNEKNYLGSFSLDHFKAIEEFSEYAKTLGLSIHFFEDFRIQSEQLLKLIDFIDKKLNTRLPKTEEAAYSRMYAVLSTALEKQKGIIAFCD